AAIRRVEEGEELTLDGALGISPAHWKLDRQRRRNALICDAHKRFLPGESLRAAGKHIVKIMRDLQAGRRQFARDELTVLMREAVATGAPLPASGRQIENI